MGSAMIELGPVTGATVEIRTLSGQFITSAITKNDGTFDYAIPTNMRSIVNNNDLLVITSTGGTDTDPADTGNPSAQNAVRVQ